MRQRPIAKFSDCKPTNLTIPEKIRPALLTQHDLGCSIPPRRHILGHVRIRTDIQIRLSSRSRQSKIANLYVRGKVRNPKQRSAWTLRIAILFPTRTDFKITVRVQEQVGRFEISMQNIGRMKRLESPYRLLTEPQSVRESASSTSRQNRVGPMRR